MCRAHYVRDKPGNVWEFDDDRKNVTRELSKSQGFVTEKSYVEKPFLIAHFWHTAVLIILLLLYSNSEVFIVLSSWHSHCESSLGSSEGCSKSGGLTFGPSRSALGEAPRPPKDRCTTNQ